MVQLTISKRWVRWWLGAREASSHYLNKWCPRLLTHVWVTRPWWLRNLTLRWRHNERDGVSNHQPHVCCSTVYTGADQRKHQSPASLAFVRGIHRSPVNSPHKRPVTRKMSPFDDVIMMRWTPTCRNLAAWDRCANNAILNEQTGWGFIKA